MNKYKTIDDFLSDQTTDRRQEINELRELILHTEHTLVENLKWNAPNYVFDGEDRITFNVANKQTMVKVIIHMGAITKENKNGKPILRNDRGIVEWSSDIRGTISFSGVSDIHSKKESFQAVILSWLAIST